MNQDNQSAENVNFELTFFVACKVKTLVLDRGLKGTLIKNVTNVIFGLPPPPIVTKLQCTFFSETGPLFEPPLFSPAIFFYKNDSDWPEMDFKHNFKNVR